MFVRAAPCIDIFVNSKTRKMGSEVSTHDKPAEASRNVQPADDAGVGGRSPAAGEPGAEAWGARSAPARQQRLVVGEQLIGAQVADGSNAQERSSTLDSSTGRSSSSRLKHSRPALHGNGNKALLMAADVQVCFGAPRA